MPTGLTSLHDAMHQFETSEDSAEALGFTEVLQNCLLCGVLAANAERRIVAFNQEAARITGLERADVIGQLSDILPPSIHHLIAETLEGQCNKTRHISILQASGASLAVGASSNLLAVDRSPGQGVVVVLNDLAAAQNLSLNIQRLDRLASIGTLSASMAHEIKNALVAVNTFVDDLLQRHKDSELAALVSRELRRIDSIVSQMLKFAGPAKPTFSEISLHRILDHSLRLVQPQLEAKQIRLRRRLSAEPDLLEADDYQLEQAFINLLLNAIAAMEPNGQLSVETELEARNSAPGFANDLTEATAYLRVTITDSGVGIAPEDLSRLFEPFFTTKPHGTGLGLAITKRIILEHRGRIKVESELGKGATFRISFPLTSTTLPFDSLKVLAD